MLWHEWLGHSGVGTPPSGKHVAHISQWHVARVTNRTIIIRTTTIRIPLRICMMQFSYLDRRKGKANDVSASPIQGRANDAGRA